LPGPRDYTRSTLMSLAHFSGGLCYYPGCPEPVLRKVDGELHIIVQIAHIRGANLGSARYDETMSDDQRRHFMNLLLLCDPHHQMADSNEKLYTAEILLRWKAQRESDPQEAMKRLREVTPAGLRKIVAEGLEEHDVKLISALERLETSDRQAAALMRSLIDELTEAYTRSSRVLDRDAIYEFSSATTRLNSLKGTLDEFIEAAHRFRRGGRGGLGEY
jgi:hypothetical protein